MNSLTSPVRVCENLFPELDIHGIYLVTWHNLRCGSNSSVPPLQLPNRYNTTTVIHATKQHYSRSRSLLRRNGINLETLRKRDSSSPCMDPDQVMFYSTNCCPRPNFISFCLPFSSTNIVRLFNNYTCTQYRDSSDPCRT